MTVTIKTSPKLRNNIIDLRDAFDAKTKKLVTNVELSQKWMSVEKWFETGKEKCMEVQPVLKIFPWPPLNFLQWLKKYNIEMKCQKLMLMFKELFFNISLVEALEQILEYAKLRI